MCLCSKQILPRRATKDIVCYKLFRKKTTKKKTRIVIRYKSLYQNNLYSFHMLNVVLHANIAGCDKPYWDQSAKYTYVRSGYFHAYQTIKNNSIQIFTSWINVVLLKCIIPKGALYYKGINDDICANKMIFVEEIDV